MIPTRYLCCWSSKPHAAYVDVTYVDLLCSFCCHVALSTQGGLMDATTGITPDMIIGIETIGKKLKGELIAEEYA